MHVVDLHCDTISALRRLRRQGESSRQEDGTGQEAKAGPIIGQGEKAGLRENRLHLDLTRMRRAGYSLQAFAAFVDLGEEADPLEACREQIRILQEELAANGDWAAPMTCWQDYEENLRQGKLSALLSLEEGAVCRGEPEILRELYQAGARMMTLTWNHANGLGHPNQVEYSPEKGITCRPEEKGLTEKGRTILEEMEALGMLVDVSHLSDGGFWDVVRHTRRPFLASHSNARAVCGHTRNLTDAMIREIGNRGGLIGLNFCVPFLRPDWRPGDERGGTPEEMAAHLRHLRDVGGMECLALGSDFDGIDELPSFGDCTGLPALWEVLGKAGFSEDQREQIFHGNAERFFRENL